ncbi:MAG: hypothetical protein FJW31_30425 [Acidobacteria bacterium]|nr:hypothetical protein [Acidobacteriota bacterium]
MTSTRTTPPPPDAALHPESGSFGPRLCPCYALVPKHKARAHPELIARFEADLIHHFGGCTTVGETKGIWLDALGVRWEDHCAVYLAAIEWTETARSSLRRLVEQLAHALDEQCIFLMVGNAATYLMWSPKEKLAQVPLPHGEVSNTQQLQ